MEFGEAVAEIEITANLRSEHSKPRKTLERLFAQHHKYIESLPKVTFRRKRKKLEIVFLSDHFTEEDDKVRKTTTNAENLNVAAKEVASAIDLIRKRLKRTDNFDTDRFLRHVVEVLEHGLATEQEWDDVQAEARKIEQAILATKSPWELLDLDWDEFHPNAREVLDDPFYWECTDDFAPNGNDTGADLLEDFKQWNKRNPNTSPLSFLDRLMQGWGIVPIDWLVTDDKTTRSMQEGDSISLRVCNETAIALAFATLKLRGKCPADVAEYGMAALKRTSILTDHSKMADDLKTEWADAEAKMASKLTHQN